MFPKETQVDAAILERYVDEYEMTHVQDHDGP